MDCLLSDQLADFQTPYILTDLTPLTTYQFRIELVTAFGKSNVYLTESVSVPFELNPIGIVTTSQQYSSLICSTPLIDNSRFSFTWFRNDDLLSEADNVYQILPPKLLPNVTITLTSTFMRAYWGHSLLKLAIKRNSKIDNTRMNENIFDIIFHPIIFILYRFTSRYNVYQIQADD